MIRNLIYDVGMHNGNDTAYYLSQGFKVIAIEANPALVEQCRHRFASALQNGQLEIVPVGIAEASSIMPFYVNPRNTEWSSFDKSVGWRDGAGDVVEVPTMRFDEILEQYKVPYYMKIDIEMGDIHCLQALKHDDVPQYLSVEAHVFEYLVVLRTLGYSAFKLIDQQRHNGNPYVKTCFPAGSSGPFGEDTPGSWLPVEDVAYEWLHHFHRHEERLELVGPQSWYDIHVKKTW
jgi:FkbM family methyltransferase